MIFSAPASADLTPYINARAFAHSEPMAINDIISGWEGEFFGGSLALTYDHAEAGVRSNGVGFGILRRYDYQLEFHPDTAELYYRTQNGLPLEPGRTYRLYMKAKHSQSRGFRLSYQHQHTPQLSGVVGLSFLNGIELTDGSLAGEAVALGQDKYDFSFKVDYTYTRDALFDRAVSAPSGQGYSIDVALQWHAHPWTAEFEVIDLVGYIDWNNAPFTTATASTDTRNDNGDGTTTFGPIASGVESSSDFRQELPRKVFLAGRYRWLEYSDLLLEVADYGLARFVSTGAGLSTPLGKLDVLYQFDTDAYTLRYEKRPYFHLALTADIPRRGEARTAGFGLQVNWRL